MGACSYSYSIRDMQINTGAYSSMYNPKSSVLFLPEILALVLVLSYTAAAQDTSARTAQNGNWSDPATWIEGYRPGENTLQVRMQHDVILDENFSFGGSGSFDCLLGPGYSSKNTLYVDAELHINSPGGNRAVLAGFQGTGISEGWIHIRNGGLLEVNESVWLGHWQGTPRGIGRGHLIVESSGRLNVQSPGSVFVGWPTELDNPPPAGSSFHVIGGGGQIRPRQLYFGPKSVLWVQPTGNGVEGLTMIETDQLVFGDEDDSMLNTDTTLCISPLYKAAIGDSWDIARCSQGVHNQIEHIITVPNSLMVHVDYDDNTLTATVTQVPGAPAAPTNFTANAHNWEKIKLAWTDNANSNYILKRGTDGVTYPVSITIDAPTNTYQDSGLEPETTYYYQLFATSHYGDSESVAKQATTRSMINGLSDEALNEIKESFEERRDYAFESLRGIPLSIADLREPLGEGRPLYTRHYSFSILNFTMRAMWNNEQLDVANQALYDHSVFYLENPDERNDRDNLHWVTNTLSRLLEFFGSNGSRSPGRVTSQTEDKIFELMVTYMRDNAYFADTQRDTWDIGIWEKWILDPSIPVPPTSENHHLMKFATIWHFSKFLKNHPAYKDELYDGHAAKEYYDAWTTFAEVYFLERSRKSLFVEMANGFYGPRTLEGIYNFYDFGEGDLQVLAGYMLDLYWASWAQEQIDGVRGGGKARIYQSGGDRIGWDSITRLAWYYLETGSYVAPVQEMMTVVTSNYRLPLVVMDIALEVEGRGVYEVKERRAGLETAWGSFGFEMLQDYGGILRYSYCTPAFVMGLPLLESRPFQDWAIMSAQNRWQGVIFTGHQDARIVPQFRGQDHSRADNALWGVQKLGSMLVQRLPDAYTRFIPNAPSDDIPITHGMRVWFSENGLQNRIEEDNWVFVESSSAFAAVRPAQGSYEWYDSEDSNKGSWMALHDWNTPVIIEVAEKKGFASYESFRDAVKALPVQWENNALIYTGLSGNSLKLYTDHSQSPEINGETINLAPDKVFESPFLNADWDAGIISIGKGTRAYVLDFNNPLSQEHHSADQNTNQAIELEELLRVVQFYNVGDYHCSFGSEDGYAPGDGFRECKPHDSDYNPQNWQIHLSELLRLVQLFNAEGYIASADAEDGYILVANLL